MKKTHLAYGDVISSIPLSLESKINNTEIAIAGNDIYYTTPPDNQNAIGLYRWTLGGGEAVRIADLNGFDAQYEGPINGLTWSQGVLYATKAWPHCRIYRISLDGQWDLLHNLKETDWPKGAAMNDGFFWFLEKSDQDNRYGVYGIDLASGIVKRHLISKDTKISSIAWGNDRLWVSSLGGFVYEIDPKGAKEGSFLENCIVDKFPGYYCSLSFSEGYLWGLDTTARRICKIIIDKIAASTPPTSSHLSPNMTLPEASGLRTVSDGN